mmetsp:Transcript_7845/g.16068  ORF Transcript_7845/g.16068 Transcript_7845/m.16068 type:complete len:215 (+) Transcript_7845:183-827(+)
MAPKRHEYPCSKNEPSINDVYLLGKRIIGCHSSSSKTGKLTIGSSEDRLFRQSYGLSVAVVLEAWRLLQVHNLLPDGGCFYQLVWALHFMKYYEPELVLSAKFGADPKTFRKQMWPFIHALSELEYQVIIFDNCYKGDQQHDCLLSVDGTDFRINWTSKAFYSHKFKGCGLWYEVALNILTGDICWINGPFEPGKYNDLMIFRIGLMGELDEGE